MNFIAAIGRVFPAFLAGTGRSRMFAAIAVSPRVRPPFYPRLIRWQGADDNLPPSGKVHTSWVDTIGPLAEPALLKEKTP